MKDPLFKIFIHKAKIINFWKSFREKNVRFHLLKPLEISNIQWSIRLTIFVNVKAMALKEFSKFNALSWWKYWKIKKKVTVTMINKKSMYESLKKFKFWI